MTATLRSYSSGIQFIVRPERTYYLVNLPMIITIANMFESFVRTMPRPNPGHPAAPVYAAMVIYAFMCKLVEVGVKTMQVRINPTQLPSPEIVMLPATIMMLIECFGEYVDPSNGVIIAPKVTSELLRTLSYICTIAWTGDPSANATLTPANWRHFIEVCYSEALQIVVNVASSAEANNIGVNFRGLSADNVREAVYDLVMKIYSANIIPFAAAANDIQAIIAGPGFGGIGPTFLAFANPAAAGVNALINNFTIPLLNRTRGRFQPLADPRANAGLPFPQLFDGLFPTSNGGTVALCGHQAYLSKYFELQKLSLHHIGNGAPLCIVQAIRQSSTVETMLRKMTIQEAILGAMLNQDCVYLVDDRGMLMNYATTGKFHPVTSTPIPAIASMMVGRGLQESLKNGHF